MTSQNIPIHQYVYVDKSFIRRDQTGFEPAVWFGLHATPARAWGLHVMLECGAVYRGLPPHAISFKPDAEPWTIEQSQLWDCYGSHFQTIEYNYLRELSCRVLINREEYQGNYLFTSVPLEDPYTRDPEQSKEFMFIQLVNDRLTIQPTNRVMFRDASFTRDLGWPRDLKTSNVIYSSEK